MNMMRIRHIIAMRKALKADPLLPPISKSCKNPSDYRSHNVKAPAKDVLGISLHISDLKIELFKYNEIICLISVNEEGSENSWKLVTTTDVMVKKDDIFIPNAFTVEYTFKRDQNLKIEIYDYSEHELIIVGMTTLFLTEILTSSPGFSKNLIKNESNEIIGIVSISYKTETKEQPILFQFHGKNFPKKGLENTQIYFQMFGIGENDERTLLYESECQYYSSKLQWKPFQLMKDEFNCFKNRSFEIACYSQDEHEKCLLIGQVSATYNELLSIVEGRNTFPIRFGKGMKKINGTIEKVKCNEMAVYSFLDYITSGEAKKYCRYYLALAIAVDFSKSNPKHSYETFAHDVEWVIRTLCLPFRRHNFPQIYTAFGFGARIPPHFRESQQFCLNLETDPNCQGSDGLIDAFRKANAQVQSSSTAHFAHIIYHLAKLASNVHRREDHFPCPYFVLAIISKGKIGDIRETIQATIFASKTPLSLIFIATEDDCDEMERLGLSAGRLSFQNRRAERDMLQFVPISKIRNKLSQKVDSEQLFLERALRYVPKQMINWLMKNNRIPQDFKHYHLSQLSSSVSSQLRFTEQNEEEAKAKLDDCFDKGQSSDALDNKYPVSTSDDSSTEKEQVYTAYIY
ncbi:unnamed protein product [Thelazia callipaeda]|uniref:Copine domain-containing protein n=1 Tax=Thelazia callipaeda TaxID=103827 RepID=A0A0N5CJ93_THECL|nr:unnamed protein product [Thelazia callipaeda]